MSDLADGGTQKIGFFGTTPVEPATAVTYEGPHYAEPDAPLFDVIADDDGTYTVQLPHQCDEWQVAWGTRDEAIAMLNAFIGAALDALNRLTEASR